MGRTYGNPRRSTAVAAGAGGVLEASERRVGSSDLYFVCRVGSRLCAIPLGRVIETLRPLPLDPLPGTPEFVLGVSMIRGRPTPVLSGSRLLGDGSSSPASRLVTVRAGDRPVALAVGEAVGVRALAAGALSDIPLLAAEGRSDAIAALGTLDRELLVVLESARLVPEGVWASIEKERE